MKKEWIPEMIKSGKLKLSFTDFLSHYLIVLFLFLPVIFTGFSFVQKYILDNYDGVRSPEEMILVTGPFGVLAILFLIIQNNRLKFKTIETNLSRDKINEIIENTAEQRDWYPEVSNDKIVIAKTHPKWWTGSWGEQITILFNDSRIMINSICDPDKKTSVVSFGRNRKNIDTLIDNINNASS